MTTFYRGKFQDLWLALHSDSALGVLDTAFVEDYFGVDGQVSLLHVASGVRVPVHMASWGPGGLDLGGWVPMAVLSDGEYRVQGRVRSLAGGYTVLDAIATPSGGSVCLLAFTLAPGGSPVTDGTMLVSGASPEARVSIPRLDPSNLVLDAPSGSMDIQAPAPTLFAIPVPGSSTGVSGSSLPALVLILRPGSTVVFPSPVLDEIVIPSPTTSARC